jgi:hypothetical protein
MAKRSVLVLAALVAVATLALLLRQPRSERTTPASLDAGLLDDSAPPTTSVQPSARAPVEPVPEPATEVDEALPSTDVIGRVVARSGGPLAGARVTFGWPPDASWEARWAAPDLWREREDTRSGEDGAFALLGLTGTAGMALVEVAHEGYCTARLEVASLATGAVIDLGDVVLDAPGAVRGRVVDERGTPLAGARVVWSESHELFSPSERRGQPGATSATDGTFEIAGLPPGAVHLCALAADRVARWSPPIPVAASRTTDGVELVLAAAVVLRGRIHERGTGAGVVAELTLYSRERGRLLEMRSGPDGAYEVRGVERDASYIWGVRAPGHAYASSDDGWGGPNVVTADARTLAEGFDVPVRAYALVPVRVVDAASGAPIAGAELAHPADYDASRPLRVSHARVFGRTDVDGRIELEGGAAAPRRFVVQADGYAPALGYTYTPYPGGDAESVVELLRGATVEVVAVRGGSAAAGAVVELLAPVERHGPAELGNPGFACIARATTGADGRAWFETLAAGSYVERVHDGGRVAWIDSFELAEAPLERRVVLGELARVHGHVAGGSPRDVVVARRAPGNYHVLGAYVFHGRADAAGRYEVRGLPAGSYRVVAYRLAPGQRLEALEPREAGVELELSLGESVELDFDGPRGAGALDGRVLVNGKPAAFRRVVCEWSAPGDAGEREVRPVERVTTTDAGGRFELDDVDAGTWTLTLLGVEEDTRWVALARTTATVDAGRRVEVELAAELGAVTIVTLERGSLAPSGWHSLSLERRAEREGDPRVSVSLLVPGTGRMTLPELPPGRYTLARAGEVPDREHEVAAGEHVEVTLEVDPR